jgi:hypothetical protein
LPAGHADSAQSGSGPASAKAAGRHRCFPDKATDCYFLPLKAEVRQARAIAAGDHVSVELTIG